MRTVTRLLVSKFQQWAVDRMGTIVSQWVGVSLVEFFNALGCYDAMFALIRMQKASEVFDVLWYIDTAYLVASLLYRFRRSFP